jgi:hypothetical protein
MREFIDSQGRRLFVQRNSEVLDILAGRQPVPAEAPSLSHRTMRLTLWLLFGLFVLIAFLIVGEIGDQPGDVHPGTSTPPHVEPASNLPWQQ